MAKMNKNSVGLVLGIFFALLHLVWAILVAIGSADVLIKWILPLHFIGLIVPITTFSILNAVMLVVMAFVGGYICGWVFAWLWNLLKK